MPGADAQGVGDGLDGQLGGGGVADMQDGVLHNAAVAFAAFPGQIGDQRHAVLFQAGGKLVDFLDMVIPVHQVVAEHVLRLAFHIVHDLAQEHGGGEHDAAHHVQIRRMLLELGYDAVDFLVHVVRGLVLDMACESKEPGNQRGHFLLALGRIHGFKHAHPAAVAEVPAGQGAAGAAEADLHAVFRVHKIAHAEHQGHVLFIQHFPGLVQDSGHGVFVLPVVDEEYPFLVPAGKGGDFKPFREAGKNGVFRFLVRHGGQHHRLEMGPGKINAQLRHGAGVVRFAVHQAVEPGIAQHRAALLQELGLLHLDLAHILQGRFDAGKMLAGRGNQAAAAAGAFRDGEVMHQPAHGPGIMLHQHPQHGDHPRHQQHHAKHQPHGKHAVVIAHVPGIGPGQHIDKPAGRAGAFRQKHLLAVLQTAGLVFRPRNGQAGAHQRHVRRAPDHALNIGQENHVPFAQGAQRVAQQGVQAFFLHRRYDHGRFALRENAGHCAHVHDVGHVLAVFGKVLPQPRRAVLLRVVQENILAFPHGVFFIVQKMHAVGAHHHLHSREIQPQPVAGRNGGAHGGAAVGQRLNLHAARFALAAHGLHRFGQPALHGHAAGGLVPDGLQDLIIGVIRKHRGFLAQGAVRFPVQNG